MVIADRAASALNLAVPAEKNLMQQCRSGEKVLHQAVMGWGVDAKKRAKKQNAGKEWDAVSTLQMFNSMKLLWQIGDF